MTNSMSKRARADRSREYMSHINKFKAQYNDMDIDIDRLKLNDIDRNSFISSQTSTL